MHTADANIRFCCSYISLEAKLHGRYIAACELSCLNMNFIPVTMWLLIAHGITFYAVVVGILFFGIVNNTLLFNLGYYFFTRKIPCFRDYYN